MTPVKARETEPSASQSEDCRDTEGDTSELTRLPEPGSAQAQSSLAQRGPTQEGRPQQRTSTHPNPLQEP
ncbi:hypothetical protein J4Q44_G00252850 [Coregonus suidteri]|uniref:Uncharacterized protein n=1 Tax=Coregonus suidteri TaxID=861788 RepID=A0AAN8QGA8_9TELE